MKEFVHTILCTHPASGWFRRDSSTSKKKKNASGSSRFSLSPDSYHSRSGVSKRNNPRYNPAP